MATAAPEPGAAGIGDPYFPLDGNGGLDVLHYDVHDRYRFGSGRLSGHTTLTVEATQDLSSFHLDFLLPVRAVRVDGEAGRRSPGRAGTRSGSSPRQPLLEGRGVPVRVSYSGRPGRRSYDGESNWLADRHEVVAMNQPHMAPWWFPSNDHPADKALMDISITVPSGKKVVANGHPVGRERHGSRVTHHWRADEPMATYLAMFAAGPFHVETGQVATGRGDVPVRLLVSKRLSDAPLRGEPEDAPQVRRGCCASSRTTSATTPSRPPAAWSPASRSGSPSRTRRSRPTSGSGAAAGTGSSCTSRPTSGSATRSPIERWRDIWLNEGAATFFEIRHRELDRNVSPQRWLQRQWEQRGESDPFWNLEIADPGGGRIFADAVYYRGGMTFQALRNRIGEADYWALLREFVTTYEGGNATTEDFEAMAEDVSGEQLDGFFDAWIHSTARPEHTAANGLVVE